MLVSFHDVIKQCRRLQKACPDSTITYLVGQLEVCPTTGNKHLQMYAEFSNSKTISAICKIFGDPNMEVQKRFAPTAEQAAQYCRADAMKNGRPKEGIILNSQFEWGEISEQGARTDLTVVRDMIQDGRTLREIAMERPLEFMRYSRGIEKAWLLSQKVEINVNLKVIWIFGKPGTFKTSGIYEKYGAENVKKGVLEDKWFSFTGQQIILFDDPDKSMFTSKRRSRMLEWLDVYPVELSTKGGILPRLCERIYITTNWNPFKVLKNDTAILRRIHKISEREIVKKLPERRAIMRHRSHKIDDLGDVESTGDWRYYVLNYADHTSEEIDYEASDDD